MKNQTRRFAFVMVMVLLLQALFIFTVAAADATGTIATNVQDARKALVSVYLIYTDENNDEYWLQRETGFLIDASYVLTTNHGLVLDETDVEDYSKPEWFGEYFRNNYKNRLSYKIVFNRDIELGASLTDAKSEAYDFAVLRLNSPINGATILPLGSDDMVDVATEVTCLGFPSVTTGTKITDLYKEEDVTVTTGAISKITTVDATEGYYHTATVNSGSSGGPTIITDNGAISVVGLVHGTDVDDPRYSFSVRISSVTDVLNTFAIPYSETGASVSVPTTPTGCAHEWGTPVNNNCVPTYTCSLCGETKQDPAQHTFGAWEVTKEATTSETGVETKTCSVCGATETQDIAKLEKAETNWLMIGLIAGIVVIVVVVVIIIIVVAGGSKKKAAPAPAPAMAPVHQPAPQPQPQYSAPRAPVPPVAPSYQPPVDNGAGETTVLNDGAGETTVLGGASNATLFRLKNNETIVVSGNEFVIGKERSRANYCISDNSSISRAHAKLVRRGSDFFVVDMNSTNFTFVNGIKLAGGQEHPVRSGDKIKLADEEFEFRA